MPHLWFTALLICFLCTFAFGGAPEKLAAMVMAVGSISTPLVVNAGPHFFRTEWGIFAIDVVDQAALTFLALRANRVWPLCVAGIHLMPLLAHLARWTVVQISPGAYARGQAYAGYVVLLLIVCGAWRHRRRLIANGHDPSWTRSAHSATSSWAGGDRHL